MVRGPWDGDFNINTGWRYSSGAPHYSWDIGCPIGTKLYAIGDGTIVDCNDGVKDQPPGRPAGSGAPSNWIILRFTAPKSSKYAGKTMYAYYQHLTKGGVKVKRGQKVKKGEVIGLSGNSGNTTGPHLHLTVLKPGHTMNAATRYAYLSNPSMVAWEPRVAWMATRYGKVDVMVKKLRPGVNNSESVKILRRALIRRGFLKVKKPLSVDHPGNKYTDAVAAAVKLWQKRHKYKQTGVFTNAQAREFFAANKRVNVIPSR